MAQREFLTSDTSTWTDRFGAGGSGSLSQNTATDNTANTTLTGTVGGTSATVGSGAGFSNGDLVLIHQSQGTGVGNWELNKISSGGGGSPWAMVYTFTNTYGTGAQVYLLKQYTTATINSGQTLTSRTWTNSNGYGGIYALIAQTSITITGTITSTGSGFQTAGVSGSINNAAQQGEGTAGAGGTKSQSANGNGGGGGANNSGAFAGSGGGGGGNANTGSNGVNAQGGAGPSVGGTGGTSVGAANLITVDLGGAGGTGAAYWNIDGGGGGGSGGGFVLLIAPTITITGSIVTNGGTGVAASRGGAGGGGGAAGGSVLLKGQGITLGSTLITATGGSGGAGATQGGDIGGAGGAGSVGRIHADYSSSISGTTNPTIDTFIDNIYANIVVVTKANSGGSVMFI